VGGKRGQAQKRRGPRVIARSLDLNKIRSATGASSWLPVHPSDSLGLSVTLTWEDAGAPLPRGCAPAEPTES
jgi:hypothetical protein